MCLRCLVYKVLEKGTFLLQFFSPRGICQYFFFFLFMAENSTREVEGGGGGGAVLLTLETRFYSDSYVNLALIESWCVWRFPPDECSDNIFRLGLFEPLGKSKGLQIGLKETVGDFQTSKQSVSLRYLYIFSFLLWNMCLRREGAILKREGFRKFSLSFSLIGRENLCSFSTNQTSDNLLISPYIITLKSNVKVTRRKEMIANLRSSWLSNKFFSLVLRTVWRMEILILGGGA